MKYQGIAPAAAATPAAGSAMIAAAEAKEGLAVPAAAKAAALLPQSVSAQTAGAAGETAGAVMATPATGSCIFCKDLRTIENRAAGAIEGAGLLSNALLHRACCDVLLELLCEETRLLRLDHTTNTSMVASLAAALADMQVGKSLLVAPIDLVLGQGHRHK